VGKITMSTSAKAPPGHFTILYFGPAENHTSKAFEYLPAPLPISKLFNTLEEKYGGIKANLLESCLLTVNLEYVDMPEDEDENDESGVIIQEGDEVAIIPPVSSG
jgi:molybdopterin converting factor small subunit